MNSRVIVLKSQPHTILLEGCGLRRLVRLVVDSHGSEKALAIGILCEITDLAIQVSQDLIEAELKDRMPPNALDRAIWNLLA